MELSEAIAIVIKSNREALGLSQEELAHGCGLDRTYISLLERCKRKPTINVIFTISQQLKLNPSDFVKKVEILLANDFPD